MGCQKIKISSGGGDHIFASYNRVFRVSILCFLTKNTKTTEERQSMSMDLTTQFSRLAQRTHPPEISW